MSVSVCDRCGAELKSSGECSTCSSRPLRVIFRRELVLLSILYIVTIPLFIATRFVADRNRRLNIATAEAWYSKGQDQLTTGDLAGAIGSFRKAVTNDHDDPRNVLALATALMGTNRDEEARQILLQLRASTPESGEINLQLARLSAKTTEPETVRYYHYAIDGTWPEKELPARKREIRTELVRFLLESEDRGRATSELLILSAEIPDKPEAHNELGGFFLQAMEWQRAMQQFTQVMALDKSDGRALLGAGKAAFNLGDYRLASRYLQSARQRGFTDSAAEMMREVAAFAISEDPLAPGLMTDERIRRLMGDLKLVSQRLQDCRAVVTQPVDAQTLEGLEKELNDGINTSYRTGDLRRNADGFLSALELISRIEGAFELHHCAGNSSEHRALVLIVKKHGVVDQ